MWLAPRLPDGKNMFENSPSGSFFIFVIEYAYMWILVFQRLLIEFVIDFFYFPIWWYTQGLKHHALVCLDLVKNANMRFAPGLWLKNIFVPMFGQYDWQGRLVSFFMRFINVILRSIAMVVWIVIVLGVFLLWIVIPVVVIYLLSVSLFRVPITL